MPGPRGEKLDPRDAPEGGQNEGEPLHTDYDGATLPRASPTPSSPSQLALHESREELSMLATVIRSRFDDMVQKAGSAQSPITRLRELKAEFPHVEFDISETNTEDPLALGIYIVMLTQDCNMDSHLLWAKSMLTWIGDSGAFEVKHKYKHVVGYYVQLSEIMLWVLAESSNVEIITQNRRGVLALFDSSILASNNRANAPWGLSRISFPESLPSFSRPGNLNYEAQGHHYSRPVKPVDVYVIDSGIYVEHSEFGGRAIWGPVYAERRRMRPGMELTSPPRSLETNVVSPQKRILLL
ncbi:Suppressor of the cold-sensitive snRNP biogenesis mutant brr1-1 [Ceratobasidium sp. 428]|nr:Suppressor of the cold-sensitive snRNP biogenesis mutant brr1-1 [Ceratobasidium sp. 428]